jgi:hypothetical protein
MDEFLHEIHRRYFSDRFGGCTKVQQGVTALTGETYIAIQTGIELEKKSEWLLKGGDFFQLGFVF